MVAGTVATALYFFDDLKKLRDLGNGQNSLAGNCSKFRCLEHPLQFLCDRKTIRLARIGWIPTGDAEEITR
jgi:hypothetical protein